MLIGPVWRRLASRNRRVLVLVDSVYVGIRILEMALSRREIKREWRCAGCMKRGSFTEDFPIGVCQDDL